MTNTEVVKIIFDKDVPVCSAFRVSVIIPTHNASQYIAATIESILGQKNSKIEAIFIDAESTDRTIEIIRSYEDSRIRLQVVPSSHLFEMINRGIAMAQGEYITVLFPGDEYLYPDAIALVMWQIAQGDFPDLFYTAATMYDEWNQIHLLFRPLRKELLRQGLQPTSLQALWIKKSVFRKLGFFDTSLLIRGALDFLIRFSKNSELSASSELRVYSNPAPIVRGYPYFLGNFRETFRIISRHYGLHYACLWVITQKDTKRLLWRFFKHIKGAFQSR